MLWLDLPEPFESLEELDESEEELPPDAPLDVEDEVEAAEAAVAFWSEPLGALSPDDSLLSAFFRDSEG